MTFLIYGSEEDPRTQNIQNLCHRRNKDLVLKDLGVPENVQFLYERGHQSVPQVFFLDGNTDELLHIGGYDDLVSYIEMVTEIER